VKQAKKFGSRAIILAQVDRHLHAGSMRESPSSINIIQAQEMDAIESGKRIPK